MDRRVYRCLRSKCRRGSTVELTNPGSRWSPLRNSQRKGQQEQLTRRPGYSTRCSATRRLATSAPATGHPEFSRFYRGCPSSPTPTPGGSRLPAGRRRPSVAIGGNLQKPSRGPQSAARKNAPLRPAPCVSVRSLLLSASHGLRPMAEVIRIGPGSRPRLPPALPPLAEVSSGAEPVAMPRYNPAQIEPKWQAYWETHETFRTAELPAGEKLYVLDMFPYPSGDGLHVGHPEGYTATDIICRFERMRGRSVLHPMGFDAFGLPAEEHAIKTNTPPRESTERNIANFRRQLKMLGFSYDWRRELATTDANYFRWTQWIFLVLFDTWFDRAAAARSTDRRTADSGGSSVARTRGSPPLPGRPSPGLPGRRAGELVPRLGDRAGQRGGDRRPERTRRLSRAAHPAAAMDAADHGVRRPAGAGSGPPGLAGQHQDDAARMDRPQHRSGSRLLYRSGRRLCSVAAAARAGRVTRASRMRMCCASTRPGPTRCSAPRTWSSRRSTRLCRD